jgi:hypothetical protein
MPDAATQEKVAVVKCANPMILKGVGARFLCTIPVQHTLAAKYMKLSNL